MLLVKGIVKDSLVDELESVGVLVLTNLSYHTLNTLAYVTNIDMVTYITDACEVSNCMPDLIHFSSLLQTEPTSYGNEAYSCNSSMCSFLHSILLLWILQESDLNTLKDS